MGNARNRQVAIMYDGGRYVPPRRTVAGADLDWIPADLDRMTVEEQLKTAVADVRCKDKLGLVQELANLDADRQQKNDRRA